MNIELSRIWRHPIKSIGAEEIKSVNLKENQTMPLDRVWALAHENTKFNFANPDWVPCSSFIRVSIAPKLMAITAQINESKDEIILSHPENITLKLSLKSKEFSSEIVKWIAKFCPESGPKGFKLAKVPSRGMTDTDYCSISLLSIDSLRDLSKRAGQNLDPRRFRGNLWVKNANPYEEFNWIGKILEVGQVLLEVVEPIERCNATKTNPVNGERDIDTLRLLRDNFNHQNFGVYCRVISSGKIKSGDIVKVPKS